MGIDDGREYGRDRGKKSMSPERCASELSKMISRFARADNLPEGWSSSNFVSLVNAYAELVKVASQTSSSGPMPETDVDAIMNTGRPNAYEDMVSRLQDIEKKSGKIRKKQ